MTAMGVSRFVVTLRHAAAGQTEERHWSKGDVMHSMGWLKLMNARGYDVLIRPDGEHGLALLGGLNKADVRLLQERGFAPAAVVETASGQYETWVTLSLKPLAEPLRDQAAQGLVRGLGVYNVAKAVSLVEGRLAGFTNQQLLRNGGRHPFVLVTEFEGKLAPAAPRYLENFEQAREKAREMPGHNQNRIRLGGRER